MSAGGLVIGPHGKIIVVSQHGNSWSLPKGHVEPGEGILAAAVREISEECGVTSLTYLGELGSYSRYRIGLDGQDDLSELKTIHLFVFLTDELVLGGTDPDNPEARWVAPAEVVTRLTHLKDRSFFEQALPHALAMVCRMVMTTFPSIELATQFQRQVVETKLAACVQIEGPIGSVYSWKGKIESSQEWRCVIKTSVFRVGALKAFIAKNHPYDVPEVVVQSISEGSVSYLSWLISPI